VEQGATVLTGGTADAEGERAHGCYVRPTVLAGVTPETAIWREEVFGPVLALRAVPDFDAAVEAVDDSGFGPAAAVFTRELSRAYRFADAAECGQVAVNTTTTTGWDVHLPFGGFRDSGTAYRSRARKSRASPRASRRSPSTSGPDERERQHERGGCRWLTRRSASSARASWVWPRRARSP
jgi:aldehyde dehydrogenase (NAD+)